LENPLSGIQFPQKKYRLQSKLRSNFFFYAFSKYMWNNCFVPLIFMGLFLFLSFIFWIIYLLVKPKVEAPIQNAEKALSNPQPELSKWLKMSLAMNNSLMSLFVGKVHILFVGAFFNFA